MTALFGAGAETSCRDQQDRHGCKNFCFHDFYFFSYELEKSIHRAPFLYRGQHLGRFLGKFGSIIYEVQTLSGQQADSTKITQD